MRFDRAEPGMESGKITCIGELQDKSARWDIYRREALSLFLARRGTIGPIDTE